jgi:hypothetical protein
MCLINTLDGHSHPDFEDGAVNSIQFASAARQTLRAPQNFL